MLKLTALVIPLICNPLTSQPIDYSKQSHEHLSSLNLADSADLSDLLEIDVLIGADSYWDMVTDQVIRGDSEPTAIHTKVGWICLAQQPTQEFAVNLTLAPTHTLKVEAYHSAKAALDNCLKRF